MASLLILFLEREEEKDEDGEERQEAGREMLSGCFSHLDLSLWPAAGSSWPLTTRFLILAPSFRSQGDSLDFVHPRDTEYFVPGISFLV
ncbi:hypothetical protein HJFPF1_08135 [Paramyrothecium foliicola]|nr:hypothetical protein HJFPF1_08135 [Paramyrothecium foliicola]